jgi:hypothetical protein
VRSDAASTFDLFRTQLQETGRASTTGMTVVDVARALRDLGIEVDDVRLEGSCAVVVRRAD